MEYIICYAEDETDSSRFRWKKANGSSPEDAVRSYCMNNFRIWDCDNCGTDYYQFAVENGEGTVFFSVAHSWWWADWETENRYVDNEFNIESIEKSFLSKRRDWLVV